MNHIPHGLLDFQISNFKALADYLDTGITEYGFDMGVWMEVTDCGTVACAGGHAPFVLGFKHRFNGDEIEVDGYGKDWGCFLQHHFSSGFFSNNFSWVFDGVWYEVDNTARGAAARIYYMLENGIPENFEEQMTGLAPLSYEVKPLSEITKPKINA